MGRFLTARQLEILQFIHEYRASHGYAPTLREICERFGFSSYGTAHKHLKLLAEKGFLRRERHQRRGLEPAQPAGRSANGGGGCLLPYLGRIAAGKPIEVVPEGDSLEVPASLLPEHPENAYVLRVVGDSMVGEGIWDGDWIVVERRAQIQPGDPVVASVGGEVTLKRFYPEGRWVRLEPANPRLAPLRFPAAEVQVQGVVVGLMRKF
jgi:repressor LexA